MLSNMACGDERQDPFHCPDSALSCCAHLGPSSPAFPEVPGTEILTVILFLHTFVGISFSLFASKTLHAYNDDGTDYHDG